MLGVGIFAANATPTANSSSTPTVVALVNGEPVYSDVLNMAANVGPTLQQIRQSNPKLYSFMTSTKDGFNFLQAYNKSVLSDLTNSVLMEQIASQDYNIQVTDAQAMIKVKEQVAQMLQSYNITEAQFSQYLQSQGYGSVSQFENDSVFTMKFSMVVSQLKNVVTSSATVSEKDISNYYNANLSSFREPKQIDVEHILLDSEATANAVLKEINSGSITFESAAAKYSLDTQTKTKNGDLGWIPESSNMPDFEVKLFASNIGDVVGPIKMQSGWELFKVVGKKDAYTKSLKEVHDQIQQQLSSQKSDQIWSNWLKTTFQNFKDKSTVKIML